MNNGAYWKRRMAQLDRALAREEAASIEELNESFDAANARIKEKIRAWYQRLADNNGITYEEAQKLLDKNELKEFKWTVDDYIKRAHEDGIDGKWKKALENASARVHITRLEAIKLQLREETEVLAAKRNKVTRKTAEAAYKTAYHHIGETHADGKFTKINTDELELMLSKPWAADGMTFSERIWSDKEKFVSTVTRELTQMVAIGESPERAISAIMKRFNVSRANAARVVHTEATAFASRAQRDCYNELDVERYEVKCSLNASVCELCAGMDGKIFKTSEYAVGVTAEPFHPNCRCYTIPYYDDMHELEARAAKDPVTGEVYEVSGGTSYKQWKKQQDEKYGSGIVDKMRKLGYNENADREQFERYKALMDDDFPATFEAFQKLKYDNPELWESYKTLARSKNYLQQKLNYVWNGEKCFIPKHTKFEKVVTMAGKDTDTAIRCVDRLVETYGGKADEWQKRAGKVTSDKYVFDLHWYESDGVQYEVKLKNRKERKRNEN